LLANACIAATSAFFFVATDGTDLSDIEPALEETGDRFVAKVMKVKI